MKYVVVKSCPYVYLFTHAGVCVCVINLTQYKDN
jgi:hypothetical protein